MSHDPAAIQGLDALPPHSLEAEQGVLGSLLNEALFWEAHGECMEECVRQGIRTEHFYDLRHRVLWDVAVELAQENKPCDLLLVTQRLQAAGRLDAIGGVAYINTLAGAVPTHSNIAHYLEILREQFALRGVLRVCAETEAAVRSNPASVTELVGGFEAQAHALTQGHVPTHYQPITDHLPGFIDMLEVRHKGQQHITGLETPWWYLNNQTCGLQRHELCIIGARPSTGKTAMATDIIRHACAQGTPVLFFSIEMNPEQILTRLIAAEARVDGMKLRNGFWTTGREEAIRGAAERVSAWKDRLFVDHRSFVTGQDVWVSARRAHRQHAIGLVVIDYLQLMRGTRAYNSRNEEVGECSAWLKRVAKELPLPVLALAQLNRESERDKRRAPTMADLRESGNVEQDADLIALLHRPALNEEDFDDMKWLKHHEPDDPRGDGLWLNGPSKVIPGENGAGFSFPAGWRDEFARINLAVEKNRNGPTGPCELLFQKRSTRFVDLHSQNRVKAEQGEVF